MNEARQISGMSIIVTGGARGIGRAFVAMSMIIASLESDMASERVTATIDHRQARGVHWGFTPFGYDRNGAGQLAPSVDAEALGLIHGWYAADQGSYHVIARQLIGRGTVAP